jgi:hypothetical protein
MISLQCSDVSQIFAHLLTIPTRRINTFQLCRFNVTPERVHSVDSPGPSPGCWLRSKVMACQTMLTITLIPFRKNPSYSGGTASLSKSIYEVTGAMPEKSPRPSSNSLPNIPERTADLQAYRQTPYTLLIPLDLIQECRTT